MTGPSLGAALQNERWADRKRLYEWIRNPEAFMKKDTYTNELRKQYGSMMQAFPTLTDDEIDAIVNYINWQYQQSSLPVADNNQ
jgi:cytochrome c1